MASISSLSFRSLSTRTRIGLVALLCLAGVATFAATRLFRFVDARIANGALDGTTVLYSAPVVVSKGDAASPESVVSGLRVSGYTADTANPVGSYTVEGDAVTVKPGRDSYFREEPVRIRFANGHIAGLTALKGNTELTDYALEPQPLVRVEDGAFEKRRPVRFQNIPKPLVNALLSAEDKHFFYHAGFDIFRIGKAAWVNLRSGRKEQGGSTLTMQLARNLYLDADKNWKRKVKEFLIAETLEMKLSKQEIFEYYVNQVYLGRRNTMGLHGFGQAAETYFGKNLSDITVPEAALLAGLVQRPSYFDPIRHPERATARRNLVLGLMQQNGFITEAEHRAAVDSPLNVAPRTNNAGDAPWFVELAMDDLQSHDASAKGRVYTTLDPGLQSAAVDAVRAGLLEVDTRIHSRQGGNHALPQVALIALDPHTGEVKALVGGRDFGQSQVNHATAMRQPGSVFKPFVYAAAMQSGAESPASLVMDAPRSFRYGNQEYRPSNFGDRFHGQVTLRNALAESMNIPAVTIAEQVGYRQVLQMARNAGFNDGLKATPAIALGAYEATPLEVSAAYTIFANGGRYLPPTFVSQVRSGKHATYRAQPEGRQVLSPAASFVMQDMLTEVLRSGTARSVRSRGLDVPAAGKTGTSRDGWFAGYVANLICVVWVGYDDNSDLDLEGAKSALPIWTEFMKRASQRSDYREALSTAPEGVTAVSIDSDSGLRAGPECVHVRREYFLKGTEPQVACSHQKTEIEPAAEPTPITTISYETNNNE